MEAKMWIDELKRMMCKPCETACSNCEYHGPICDLDGFNLEVLYKAIEMVEKWSAEHPKRTYLDVLLEAFPNARVESGTPFMSLCPYELGLETKSNRPCNDSNCLCYDCWNREYKEDK